MLAFQRLCNRFPFIITLFAVSLGVLLGLLQTPIIDSLCSAIAEVFVRILKFLSLPIIFLSLFVTISGMKSGEQAKKMLQSVFSLTIITTIAAASVGLALFSLIRPVQSIMALETIHNSAGNNKNYLSHLLNIIPSNFIQPFLEGNVVSILIIALVLAFTTLSLQEEHRLRLHDFFASLYRCVMKITEVATQFIPVAVCAFVALFVKDLRSGVALKDLGLYLATLVSANLVQACIILPLLLIFYGLRPLTIAKGMAPALSVAFFSKSSCCALPTAIQCAEDKLNISPAVARVTFPLCTTINMNACAAFILITVLFVAQSNGIIFSSYELIVWVGIATIAAVGNAGVPMGCYFLTSALLSTMDVPLTWMGIILPFYALIDMLETAINIWSDSCVAAIVDAKRKDAHIIDIFVEPQSS